MRSDFASLLEQAGFDASERGFWQRVIMIESSLSKNLSIVAAREETNDSSAFSLDIRLRRRY